jgi:DNA helicase IV
MLYSHLDDLRRRASGRLSTVLATASTNHQQRSQRDLESSMYKIDLAQLDGVENGLCFGRLDFADGSNRYIGRIGISRPDHAGDPLLVDWRAPGSRPFYLATVASPEGVARRRHIQTRFREVIGVEDEALDQSAADSTEDTGSLVSEGALLSALTADRTGQMRDIVETIQTEQDEIIRSDQTGVLVVEGGPGTGKTAVALHRAAYLLYHHREALSKRAVLIIGPNTTFLRYIGRVLPGLGETAVVLSTIGEMFPGVHATGTEPDAAAEIKGRPAMADVLVRAVADRQRVPDEPFEVEFDKDVVVIEPAVVERARGRARAAKLVHNQARLVFVRHMVDALARQVADKVGADVFGGPNLLTEGDMAVIREDLGNAISVQLALDELWPDLTPQRLLEDLYADSIAVEIAAPDFSREERALLRRRIGSEWTVADVPLLDEAAELLGVDDSDEVIRQEAEAERDRAYAEGVLDILSRDVEDDLEVLMAWDLLDADQLAERHLVDDGMTVAERAAADRQWAYGHIIVDEAQELSPMAWRMVMRHSPNRSLTLVGDVAQTSEPSGTSSWAEVLEPYVEQRWRLDRLTVNYRTPAEIMAVAEAVRQAVDPDGIAPTSIRSVGTHPWRRQVADLSALADIVRTEQKGVGDGRIAVLVTPETLAAARDALPDAAVGAGADLTEPVVLLTVRQAKGLEFDSVLVVEPSLMLDASDRGANDLYVALTRATKRLGIVHTGPIPALLESVATG